MSETIGDTAIIVERLLPYPPEKIWRVLTDTGLLSKWLMPNSFEPVVGHSFQFQTRPMGNWDGVVHCEVLECVPPNRLRYSWVGGSDDNDKYGSRLNSVVSWTLIPASGGTLLHMEHDGFGPGNAFAFDAMSSGWARIAERIGEIAATLD